ncbi:MAG: DeoR/GlpR transcriptional regulator, partial [Ruminococcus sp.]|nr:DeoR/GlpR transcriptional regulator [Candidatus Copronaster equi]
IMLYNEEKMLRGIDMLSDARQDLIKKIALRDGEVIISKTAAELGVSLETVRRDINVLCEKNILSKVHGGAVPIKITEHEGLYLKRKSANMPVKKALGKYVSGMIKNSGVLFFSVGTTVEAAATECSDLNNLSVITNSVPVAEIFGNACRENSKNFDITLAGGHLNAGEHFTYGSQTQTQISNYRADTAVISSVGIDENGIMCVSDEEGEIISEMMKAADRVILVIESYKFMQKSVYRFSSLKNIDEIVTDNNCPIPEKTEKALKNYNISVHIINSGGMK